MTELVDEYTRKYNPIEGFVLRTKTEFTPTEFAAYVNGTDYDYDDETGEGALVEYLFPERNDVDKDGYSLTDVHPNGKKKYYGHRYRYRDGVAPIGYCYYEPVEVNYEGGTIQGLGTVEVLNRGNLGDGHEAWVLYQHVESGRLFRQGGWYSSWGGGEMDDEVVEVEPANVTVVRYKPLGSPDSEAFEYPCVTV